MRFASVCSGIEAASSAWHPLGWCASWLSEIDPFACSVLAHHYPDVPNLGDMTRIGDEEIAQHDRPDVLVGGTPCQSFSVAGLRKGMADPRGNLALVFLRLLERTRARWVVWENVPGVLSSAGGRDFGAFLGALGQLGYGWAYRVLDAQYFGLAQRRKRVFVVAHLGGLSCRAAAVLFESASLRGDPAPSREAGAQAARGAEGGARIGVPDPAYTVAAGAGGGKFGSGRDAQDTFVIEDGIRRGISRALSNVGGGNDPGANKGAALVVAPALAATLSHGGNPNSNAPGRRKEDDVNLVTVVDGCATTKVSRDLAFPLRADQGSGSIQAIAFRKSRRAQTVEDDETWVDDGRANTLNGFDVGDVRTTRAVVAFAQNQREEVRDLKDLAGAVKSPGTHEQTFLATGFHVTQDPISGEIAPCLSQGNRQGCGTIGAQTLAGVRRLTPRECERLQGFPDDYTLVPHRGKPASDGPRYRALGNSMAVPVMAWIGKRIQLVEEA